MPPQLQQKIEQMIDERVMQILEDNFGDIVQIREYLNEQLDR